MLEKEDGKHHALRGADAYLAMIISTGFIKPVDGITQSCWHVDVVGNYCESFPRAAPLASALYGRLSRPLKSEARV